MTPESHQLVGKLELNPVVDLARAAVIRMLSHESGEGVGVGLLRLRCRVADGGLLLLEDLAPFRLVVRTGILGGAGEGKEEQQDQDRAAHRDKR